MSQIDSKYKIIIKE